MDKIFFHSWDSLERTFLIGIFAYVGLVLMLRITGNRTLSQINAFDFIVTVALGSTLATVILNKNVALADGFLALALLIALQLAVSSLSVRFSGFRRLVKTEPFLLFFRGKFLPDSLKAHRITEDEILQIARVQGISSLDEVDAVVLESNGQFSVLTRSKTNNTLTLKNVVGFDERVNKVD